MKPTEIKKLKSEYRKRRQLIKKRLAEFRRMQKAGDKDIFAELCFCLLTPQTKAVNCDKAIRNLKKSGLLFNGSAGDIRPVLKGLVRFHNKKSLYIVTARKTFTDEKKFNIKKKLDLKNILRTRDWLVSNVKGLSYKEAGHFLRNVGLGCDITILDVHILRNLKRLGVIKKIPSSISKKCYAEIEGKMRDFAKKTKIPLGELDLLFWSRETGFIFK